MVVKDSAERLLSLSLTIERLPFFLDSLPCKHARFSIRDLVWTLILKHGLEPSNDEIFTSDNRFVCLSLGPSVFKSRCGRDCCYTWVLFLFMSDRQDERSFRKSLCLTGCTFSSVKNLRMRYSIFSLTSLSSSSDLTKESDLIFSDEKNGLSRSYFPSFRSKYVYS